MRYYFLVLGALVVVCTGCASLDTGSSVLSNREHVAPPAALQSRPGPMVDGPGPGVMSMLGQPGMGPAGNAGMAGPPMSTQIKFVGPDTMTVGWRAGETFASSQVQSGQYYDFYQSAEYQLMLTRGSNFLVSPLVRCTPLLKFAPLIRTPWLTCSTTLFRLKSQKRIWNM